MSSKMYVRFGRYLARLIHGKRVRRGQQVALGCYECISGEPIWEKHQCTMKFIEQLVDSAASYYTSIDDLLRFVDQREAAHEFFADIVVSSQLNDFISICLWEGFFTTIFTRPHFHDIVSKELKRLIDNDRAQRPQCSSSSIEQQFQGFSIGTFRLPPVNVGVIGESRAVKHTGGEMVRYSLASDEGASSSAFSRVVSKPKNTGFGN